MEVSIAINCYEFEMYSSVGMRKVELTEKPRAPVSKQVSLFLLLLFFASRNRNFYFLTCTV